MSNSKNKGDRHFIKITHMGELLIWLIVVLIIVSISSMSFIFKERDDERDYKVFLPDAYGLTVGSPVRMMGVEVGHVVKIKPMRDEVYVKFVLTNNDVYIPRGSMLAVEFSGLAGSKSLELYLPDEKTYVDLTVPIITVQSAKRLNEAVGLLGLMYRKMMSIIYTSSSFSEKVKTIEMPTDKNMDIQEFLQYSDSVINAEQKRVDNIKKFIERRKK